MCSPKQKVSIDDQSDIDIQANTPTRSDVNSPIRSYALIQTDSNELDHVIDILRQFFPNTRIIERNNQTDSSQQQISIESNSSLCVPISSFEGDTTTNDQLSSYTNSQTFKGKVKDYLQRRYLEQISEHQSRKEILTKYHSDDFKSFDISTLDKPAKILEGRSLDSSFILLPHSASDTNIHSIQTDNRNIVRSQSKRGILQRCATVDMDDEEQITSSDETGKIPFSIHHKRKSRSYSEQQTRNNDNSFLVPYHHSIEQEQRTLSFTSGTPLPHTPYSASSDPGPYHSPWLKTPTTPYGLANFRFPHSQEQLVTNAQGSIVQLSTLTKILCNDTRVFASISPRSKIETHESNIPNESSSVPPCQICQQQLDSHQTYLAHYRTHLENSCEDDKSGILNSETNCGRLDDLRNYLCKICSKRFSRSDMLNRHLRLHSGIRPYRCPLCNTHFSRSDHLSTHLRTHTGEKPYTCPHCSYTACRRDMITRHLNIHTKQGSERKNAISCFASSNES